MNNKISLGSFIKKVSKHPRKQGLGVNKNVINYGEKLPQKSD